LGRTAGQARQAGEKAKDDGGREPHDLIGIALKQKGFILWLKGSIPFPLFLQSFPSSGNNSPPISTNLAK
jgi:hypothetical protein